MDGAIRLTGHGCPEMLRWIDWPPEDPGPGEIRLRHEAIGVNFLDTYHRMGLYPLPDPAIPGVEGAGVVEAFGDGVEGVPVGQRVAYAGVPGAYAATRLLPAWRAVPLPEEVSAEVAAASLLRGLTAQMLLTRTCPVSPGAVVLVHAAAGGLGAILTRWIKHLGGTVIGTAGSEERAALARDQGADHVVVVSIRSAPQAHSFAQCGGVRRLQPELPRSGRPSSSTATFRRSAWPGNQAAWPEPRRARLADRRR